MRRREFLALVAGAAAAWPAWARAPKQHRIAIVQPAVPYAEWRRLPLWRPFFPELRRLGEVEGQNLAAEYFTAEGHVERYAALARQVASRDPDVIVTAGDMVPALMSATHTIPIVAITGAPVLFRQVANLAKPGGNLTGVSVYSGIEVVGKQLEFLKEAVPTASRVAVLGTEAMTQPLYAPAWSKMREYTAKLGMSLSEVPLLDLTPHEIEGGFAEVARRHADAMLVSGEAALLEQGRLIVRLAEQNRLPAMYTLPFFSEIGGLMTYAYDPTELGRQLADDVHRILHGTKPGDIPIYQPTRFRLTINLKAAKAIGLKIPPSLLARADEVIR